MKERIAVAWSVPAGDEWLDLDGRRPVGRPGGVVATRADVDGTRDRGRGQHHCGGREPRPAGPLGPLAAAAERARPPEGAARTPGSASGAGRSRPGARRPPAPTASPAGCGCPRRRPRRVAQDGLRRLCHRPGSRGPGSWTIGRAARASSCAPAAAPARPAFARRGGSSCTIRYSAPMRLSLTSYGGWPASRWKSVAPSDQTSAASVAVDPEATSGARYAGDPVTRPVWVSEASASARAIPKSVSFTSPAWLTSMLDGLTSRWMMPAPWAAASASAACRISGPASSGASAPSRWTNALRVMPSTYSITSQVWSLSSTRS